MAIMTNKSDTSPQYHRWVLFLLIGLTVLRLASLITSPMNLHGDEAQYWSWSREFDWGYFSKPPMIAWLIGATTSIFGNAEWAVRLSSPLIHPLTAYVIFRTARFFIRCTDRILGRLPLFFNARRVAVFHYR